MRRERFRPSLEILEDREVPASLADLVAVRADAPASGTLGQTISVSTRIDNVGGTATGSFSIQYRLSTNSIISSADTLLKTVTVGGIAAGSFRSWSESVSLGGSLPFGRFYIGIMVDTGGQVAESNESNNAVADASTIQLLSTRLSGTASYNGDARSIWIEHRVAGQAIRTDVNTWIVVHGRNSSPSSSGIAGLAAAIDAQRPDSTDQVLVLNWAAAAESGWIGGNGENYIVPVASWAASILSSYGFTTSQLNFAGHSWGAYVSAETAERITGGVNSIIALDPATNYPGGSYNPEASGEVNFARNSLYSWAFFESWGDPYGSESTSATADEAFVVRGSSHSGVVNCLANLLTKPSTNAVARHFQLSRLLTRSAGPWSFNRYDSSGNRSNGSPFEATFWAASGGNAFSSLKYFDGTREVTLTV